MSHVATVDIEVKDLDVLEAACKRIGLELMRGQQTYKCYFAGWSLEEITNEARRYSMSTADLMPAHFDLSEMGKCEHAIRVAGKAGAYEIGIAKRRDGRAGFTLLWDNIDLTLSSRVGGESCGMLKQAYALEAAKKQGRLQGFGVREVSQANGSVRLVLSK